MSVHRLTDKDKRFIRENLPHSTYVEVGRNLGFGRTAIRRYAIREGIQPDYSYGRKIRVEQLKLGRTAKVHQRISVTMKELYRKERLREKYGLNRVSKLKTTHLPKKIRSLRQMFSGRHGYILEDTHYPGADPYVIYYDPNTLRCLKEQYYVERYGFVFFPIVETKFKTLINNIK